MLEYRLESRYSDAGEWEPDTTYPTWTDKTRAIKAWVRAVATGAGIWQYRIGSREISEWQPIENMDEALAILAEGRDMTDDA